jgi:hypothetical protein
VRLHAALVPGVSGHDTGVRFGLRIVPTTEFVPPSVVEATLRYPAGLDVPLSGLGIDACSAAALELSGPQACPPNSLMGVGSAVAEFAIKHEIVREKAKIAIVRTTERKGHLTMLLCVYGETAVDAQILLSSELLPAAKPFGGLLKIQVPLVPSFPEAPAISVTEINVVLGPGNLTYRERVHGKTVSYKPAGIPLPRRCPRGGFPFAVELSFLSGARASSSTAVPCRRHGKRHPAAT